MLAHPSLLSRRKWDQSGALPTQGHTVAQQGLCGHQVTYAPTWRSP